VNFEKLPVSVLNSLTMTFDAFVPASPQNTSPLIEIALVLEDRDPEPEPPRLEEDDDEEEPELRVPETTAIETRNTTASNFIAPYYRCLK
jgi:hypothetical protein